MAALFERGNDAVKINAPTDLDFHITDHGSDWLWAAFSLFAFCALLSIAFTLPKPKAERPFNHTTSFALIVISITYFTLASNLGWTDIRSEFNNITTSSQSVHPGVRQIFYARYVGWFLAFPAFLLNFAVFASVNWSITLFTIACQEVTVITLLIGSLISSSYKWGYFTFAAVSYLLVAYNLLFSFRRAAADSGIATKGAVLSVSYVLILLLYPVAWGLSEGGNVIQPDSEAVFYGVLDVAIFAVIGTGFLLASHGADFFERAIAGTESPFFHKNNTNQPTSPVAATKEAHLERHSGETATEHAQVSQHAAHQVAQESV